MQTETKDYVTHFAFVIDPDLIGCALAKPFKRLLALGVDLSLIAVAASIGDTFTILCASLLCFRGAITVRKRSRSRLRFSLLMFLAVIFAIGSVTTLIESTVTNIKHAKQSIAGDGKSSSSNEIEGYVPINYQFADIVSFLPAIAETVEIINQQDCSKANPDCYLPVLKKFNTDLIEREVEPETRVQVLMSLMDSFDVAEDNMVDALEELVPSADVETLVALNIERESLNINDIKVRDGSSSHDSSVASKDEPDIDRLDEALEASIKESLNIDQVEDTVSSLHLEPNSPSIIKMIEGLIRDLGLSFGFAAVYFSVFLAYWHGQTPGKWLFGLKVQRLDGKRMNLWDSFGRYGGYGAGIATGLLGFLQVYWDANRMAIQDKISETVVIDTRKPRYSVGR